MKHAGDPGLPVRHDPCPCPPPTPRNGRPHARIHRRASVSVSHTGASGNARRSSCVSGHVRRSRRIAPRPSPGAGGPACGRGPGPRRRRRRDLRTAFGPTAFMSCLTCGMPCRYPSRAAKPERREDRALARVFPDRGERHPTRAPARSGTLAVGRALACGGPASSQGNARPTAPRASSPFGRDRPTRRRRASVPQVLVTAHAGHRHLRVRQRRPVDVLVGRRP